VDSGAGIESAGEGEANFFPAGQVLENVTHLKYCGRICNADQRSE
jgi:hypothetical protein